MIIRGYSDTVQATEAAVALGERTADGKGIDAPPNPVTTLWQIDIQSAAIAEQQIAEITSESKNAYVQALPKGESTTVALAAADVAAAAAIDKLTDDATTDKRSA